MSKLLECALPIASDLLLPHITKVVNAIKDAPKDVADMKDKLDRIQDIIHEVDRIAAAEEDNTVRDGIRTKMKQMIETCFRMEDMLDEYTIREERQHGDDPGCAALPSKTVDFAKALTSRLQFSYMNADVKSEFQGVQEGNKSEEDGSQNQSSLEQGSSSSGGNQNATLLSLQDAPLYIKEADVVGFDVPKMKLIDWSVDKREDLTVMCVVGIGGQGKTTLVKKVFDSREVVEKFNCRIWITVSQSYTIEGLLRDMLQKLYKAEKERQKLSKAEFAAMDRRSLIDEVREHLCNKRYVVVFDDVWNQTFWDEMQYALIDNENGSRIFITTRKKDVAMYCKKSVSVQEHELQPLALDMSLALFNKKAFGSDDGCPDNLKDVSIEIFEKCEGLPLAIVAIGGLLSQDSIEWQMFSQNLSYHLGKDPDLTVVKQILALSYHDLPYRFLSCFFNFGI